MKIANDNNKNLISNSLGFYLYELLGADYSGVYISSFEIKKISQTLGFEIKLTDNQKMFGETLTAAKEANKTSEALALFRELVNERINEYDSLANKFPKAQEAIDEWRIKAKRAMRKIDNAIKEASHEPNP